MTKNLDSQLDSSTSIDNSGIVKPASELYSIFSQVEILEMIHALEFRRELPLKYFYKGRGAKIWDSFYLKFIIPNWYRRSNVEINLLKDNFEYINHNFPNNSKLNIIDVGSGNSYPVKEFVSKLNKLGRVNKYIALDISEELLNISKNNFQKWFPSIKLISDTIDIENSCIPKILLKNEDNLKEGNIHNVIFLLGVTIGNLHNRSHALKNLKNSMNEKDLLVFTNEIGCNSKWDGLVRGGCYYHAKQIYEWVKNTFAIKSEDCELIRKYDSQIDSVVANIKFSRDYTINFKFMDVDKTIKISSGEEITIWRHHKYEIPELTQEIEQAGLKLIHYKTNKYSSHIMAICSVDG
ncbi:MAG: L-histidine N(alpha)-methyltransferase [Scytonematopsis contorta HA4267-MV1]|jgi:uncharacterized SAM-dependent methyltransferase|nr:L-histidine N(alpha)-methyltransferase [Scytonematopsis contorta HA4267-MV1]